MGTGNCRQDCSGCGCVNIEQGVLSQTDITDAHYRMELRILERLLGRKSLVYGLCMGICSYYLLCCIVGAITNQYVFSVVSGCCASFLFVIFVFYIKAFKNLKSNFLLLKEEYEEFKERVRNG